MVTMKFRPVKIELKPEDEGAEGRRNHGRCGAGAVRRVEGPAGVDRVDRERRQHERRAEQPQVVAREVQPREGDVLGAELERQDDVAERGGDARDDHQEHHDRAVQREHLVVGVGRP